MNPARLAITRRRLLQAGAGALLSTTSVTVTAKPEKSTKRVVVIGGCIGGLSCAYDLMERGHDVTVLEASRRTGGHVKTIYDPLPDGLYADVGAEQFTNPGYDIYREWVRKFDLPVLPYARRRNMYANVRDNSAMGLVYECAHEVVGESCVLMGSGLSVQTPEDTIAAFRKFYPGKNEPAIEQCIVHQWWKEEPLALGCERHAFPFGQLAKI